MVYNKADQLVRWPGMHGDSTHDGYTYYGDGSLQAVWNAGGTSSLASYTYTPAGLLATANFGNTRTLTNTWDADSNRVGLSVEDHGYSFVYDQTAGIPAVIEEVNAGSTTTTTVRYFREPSGALLSRVEGATTHYYHFDALGSTRLLTTVVDQSVVVSDKYAYDAYGSLISHDRLSGSIDQPYQYVGQLGYYAHYQEPEFGLLQLGVRFYDAEVGRFTQRDPIRDGLNSYAYVENLPTSVVDPTGLRLCYCRYRGRTGRLRIDKSCKNSEFDIVVLPEHGSKHGGQPPDWGNWVDADGFVINGKEYKQDGSTCVTLKCEKRCGHRPARVTMECCINLLALIGGKGCPRPYDWPDYP